MKPQLEAYLDIETTGLSPSFNAITVIGIFRCNGNREEFIQLVGENVTRDNLLYALRDVTATVGSYPLIASSIMSKKLAVGARVILFDVKVGRGAFMKTEQEAVDLARIMIGLAKSLGKSAVAVISDMNQPLGHAVGNSLEVKEALDTLRGHGPADFTSHCLTMGVQMLLLTGQAKEEQEARSRLEKLLLNGEALERFKDLVRSQGGDTTPIDDPGLLPQAPVVHQVTSPRDGYVSELDAMVVGLTALELGAGRKQKGDPVDHAVGVVLHKKIGDSVRQNEVLCTVHDQSEESADAAEARLLDAYAWEDHPVKAPPLVYQVVG